MVRLPSVPLCALLLCVAQVTAPFPAQLNAQTVAAGAVSADAAVDVAAQWLPYFQRSVTQLSAKTAAELAAITPENRQAVQQVWREELQEMLGLSPWPERTELQATTVGSLALEGVSVDRLHYQSRPGLYVAANLYKPTAEPPPGGWPAVLYVCGHAVVKDHGRLLGNKTGYQQHGLWLARHGVVCLIIDTVQLGEFHGQHHGTYQLGRWDWMSRGYTPAGVEAWNSIRAVDLLQSLPYVDGEKIGITGRSGGGAYSWFAAALDERIQVAVPVAGITDLQNHILDGCVEGHCDCMYFVNYFGWDYAKLAALIAPRPLLLSNSDTDRIFPLDGVMRIHWQLDQLYDQLEQSSKYGVIITPGPHKDTQELQVGAFKWLLKHLTGNEPVIDSAALKEIAPKDLLVFTRETPLNERVSTLADWFVPQPTAVLEPKSAAELWRTRWLPELRRLGTLPSAATPPTQFVSLAQGRLADGKRWDLYRSEGDEPAIQIYHVAGDNAATPVIHLGIADTSEWDGQSAESWWALESVQRVLAAMPDRGHYFVKWRGAHWLPQTERAKKRNQLVRRFYLLGQSPERLATCDFIAAAKWIASRSDASQGIELAGQGRSAAIALLAGLCLQAEEPDKQLVRGLRIEAFTAEPLLAPMLVGYLRVCNFDSLRAAAEALFPVHTGADPADSPAPLLVETSHEPQQANGLRIVEVSQQQAHVWVRATRWPLPNLGDLPEVQFEGSADSEGKRKVQRQVVPILPDAGVAGLRYAVPGVRAQARVGYRPQSGGSWTYSEWREVRAESDYSTIFALDSLQPGSGYEVRTEVRGLGREDVSSRLVGEFKTLPAAAEPATFRLAVGTCQGFDDRDGDHGFDVYRTMLDRHTDALVMAGDVVYYDSLARNTDLAYYHWQRTYGLPTLVEFHRRVPSYFLKDDHDTYVDDSWPGKRLPWTGEFTFEDGQRIFRQQTALPQTPYRTFHIGSDLQIWLMEGRDFRSPNNAPDSPQKSIWGEKQKEWLKSTLENSTAKFRVVISPTPLVGPDRDGKRDNHSNSVFATEGKEMRALLAAQPNTVAICGDRHWQYHSVDPESGLHEFSVGPVSDRHAEGWMQEDFRPEIHKYLRVAGGYLELDLSGESGARRLTLRHLDTTGREHHQFTLQ